MAASGHSRSAAARRAATARRVGAAPEPAEPRPAAPGPERNPSAPNAEGRRARRRRELHERIHRTARSLFLSQGFEATTVEQIATAADIAPATFFNHFPSKEDVVREMARDVFARFRALVAEQRARPVSTAERLDGFARRGAQVVERTPELTRRVLLEVLRTAAPPGRAGPQLVAIQHDLGELLREGQRRGDVRRDTDAGFLAEMVVGAFHGTIIRWMNDSAYPLHERMRQAAAFLGDALRPRRGGRRT